ncbi:unnamed protein product [Mytilus coruscus]|uniref:Uncharacterized protein n=1 Tax=Mytilus coruscus TaxID=42192 RepID=A0A6J8D9N0_MYTCO|nr:unnamed protein product [Mytilus coruscus]
MDHKSFSSSNGEESCSTTKEIDSSTTRTNGRTYRRSLATSGLHYLATKTTRKRRPNNKEESNSQNEAGIDIIMDITRYSSLFKTIRVTAFILRFVANCKIPKSQRKPDQLTTSELQHAMELWVMNCQQRHYSEEIANLKSQTRPPFSGKNNSEKYIRDRTILVLEIGGICTIDPGARDRWHFNNRSWCSRWVALLQSILVLEMGGIVTIDPGRVMDAYTKITEAELKKDCAPEMVGGV